MFERTHNSETSAVTVQRPLLDSPNVQSRAATRRFQADMRLQMRDLDRLRGPGSEERLRNVLASPVTQAFNSFVLFPIDKPQGKFGRTS